MVQLLASDCRPEQNGGVSRAAMRELLVPPQQLAAWAVTNDPKEADKVVFMHVLPGLMAYVVPAMVATKLGDQDLALEYATFSLVRHAHPRPLQWHAAQIAGALDTILQHDRRLKRGGAARNATSFTAVT